MHLRDISRRAFTLIELLVVIAIIAILSVVVILVLNPADLLRQSRDTNRLADMDTLNKAIALYSEDVGGSLGVASTTYISIPDPVATSTAGTQCQGLGLPALASGTQYHCAASSTFNRVDGTGWIPLNLSRQSFGQSLGALPIDSINTTSSGFYYTYTAGASNQYEVTGILESQKYKAQFAANPIVPGYPEVIAAGSSLNVSSIYNSSGLVGYWPMDEGSGTIMGDASGNNSNGIASGTSPYFTGGRVGSYAANFNGSNNQINATVSALSSTIATVSFWMNLQTYGKVPLSLGNFSYYVAGGSCAGINNGGNTFGGAYNYLNQWVYVTLILQNGNYSANSSSIYYNGQLFPSTICAGSGVSATLNPFLIIGEYFSAGFKITGAIDDFRMYNRALSPAEIQALYNAEK